MAASLAFWSAAPVAAQFSVKPGSEPTKPPSKDPAKDPAKDKKKDGAPKQPELWEPGDEILPPKPLTGPKTSDGTETAPSVSPGAGTDAPAWSVLLATFTQEDNAKIASAMRDRLSAGYPQLRDCFVQRVARGSVILVGRFRGPDDPAAQAKLKEIKAISVDGQRPFAGAMLTRTATSVEPPGPYDVSKLRAAFPTIAPLYSLQVAAWSTFGDKSLQPSAIRGAAEKYCKELRARRIEAWVHHDETTNTSVVTVGHFDHRAYDSKSTLYSADVQALMNQFPRHLVNGEETLVPVDPRKPDGPKKPQACRLVEIPR